MIYKFLKITAELGQLFPPKMRMIQNINKFPIQPWCTSTCLTVGADCVFKPNVPRLALKSPKQERTKSGGGAGGVEKAIALFRILPGTDYTERVKVTVMAK